MVLVSDGETFAEEVIGVVSTEGSKSTIILTDGSVIQVDSSLVTEIDDDMVDAFIITITG